MVFLVTAFEAQLPVLEHHPFRPGFRGALLQSIRRVVEQLTGGCERPIEEAGDVEFGEGHVTVLALPEPQHQLIESVAGSRRDSCTADQPGAEQQDVHVRAVAILQREAGRLDPLANNEAYALT